MAIVLDWDWFKIDSLNCDSRNRLPSVACRVTEPQPELA